MAFTEDCCETKPTASKGYIILSLLLQRVGISADRAANYHADGEGTRLNYEAVSQVVSEIRANRPIGDSWKAKIDADYEHRGKNR